MVELLIKIKDCLNYLSTDTTEEAIVESINKLYPYDNAKLVRDPKTGIVDVQQCTGCLWELPAQEEHMDPVTGCLR